MLIDPNRSKVLHGQTLSCTSIATILLIVLIFVPRLRSSMNKEIGHILANHKVLIHTCNHAL